MQNNHVQFLSVEEVLEIHDQSIARFGGIAGIRDQGLLESALFRPQTGYYDDLPAMAAALFESLLLNRAFIDGNKRVGFFSTDVFLRLNGYKMAVDGKSAHRFLIDALDRGGCDYDALLVWIRRGIVELT